MRFDDFTDAARRAVVEANTTATREGHPQLIQPMHRLGNLLSGTGRVEEAETLLSEAVAINRHRGDGKFAILLYNLAFVQLKLGHYDEAADNFRKSWRYRQGVAGMGGIQISRANLGLALAEAGQPEAGEEEARQALLALRKRIDNNTVGWRAHVHAARAQGVVGRALHLQGRYDEAEVELLASFETCAEARSAQDGTCQGNARFLVDLYDDWHARTPDAGHDIQAAAWRERLVAPASTRDSQ